MKIELVGDSSPLSRLSRDHGSCNFVTSEYGAYLLWRALNRLRNNCTIEVRENAQKASACIQVAILLEHPELKPILEQIADSSGSDQWHPELPNLGFRMTYPRPSGERFLSDQQMYELDDMQAVASIVEDMSLEGVQALSRYLNRKAWVSPISDGETSCSRCIYYRAVEGDAIDDQGLCTLYSLNLDESELATAKTCPMFSHVGTMELN